MAMFDEEVPKVLVRHFGTLDKEIVAEAEEMLASGCTGTLEDRTRDARRTFRFNRRREIKKFAPGTLGRTKGYDGGTRFLGRRAGRAKMDEPSPYLLAREGSLRRPKLLV